MSIDKSTKYDRQLRLWESTGQQKLEDSSICLINATATGSELLKNLVLPGIGQFTIISDLPVTPNSLSGNFFLDDEDIGKPLATAITEKLVELNTDVQGNAMNDNLNNILKNESPEFWNQFSAVVVCDFISSDDLDKLQDITWNKKIPLFVLNTLAFYGSLKLIMPETTVVETHDPSRLFDLRIDNPWEELKHYADSIHLNELDDTDHAHIPYIVIFLKALTAWKQDHNNLPPRTYPEKKSFRYDYVEALSRDIKSETNFIEASQSVHRALQSTRVPQPILNLFEHSKIKDENLNYHSPMFWIYVKALKNFVIKNDVLPLPGNIPDMASDTTNYIKIQSIYREKALKDMNEFTVEVLKILENAGRSEEGINKALIATFCKNTALLHVAEGSKDLCNNYLIKKVLEGKGSEFDTDQYNILSIHFAILTFNLFIQTHGRIPTTDDFDGFTGLFVDNFSPSILIGNLPNSVVLTFREVLAHNSTSYHNMSSFMGGIASQEILKIVTGQYIPLDNLFVFDGIRSVSEKWKV